MIYNRTGYSMKEIYEYLADYTTKLNGKIRIDRETGEYYDTLYVKDIEASRFEGQFYVE